MLALPKFLSDLLIEKCLFEVVKPRKKLSRAFWNQARAFTSLELIYCKPKILAQASEAEPRLVPALHSRLTCILTMATGCWAAAAGLSTLPRWRAETEDCVGVGPGLWYRTWTGILTEVTRRFSCLTKHYLFFQTLDNKKTIKQKRLLGGAAWHRGSIPSSLGFDSQRSQKFF